MVQTGIDSFDIGTHHWNVRRSLRLLSSPLDMSPDATPARRPSSLAMVHEDISSYSRLTLEARLSQWVAREEIAMMLDPKTGGKEG